MNETRNLVEVCFSPLLFPTVQETNGIVVIVDILRATSSICTAFENGATRLIPVGTIEEARKYKEMGYLVAAERDGIVKEFADFGNSPFNFTKERVSGKEIVYSTTNGTKTIREASKFDKVVIGSFLNLHALYDWLVAQNRDVLILCAGWKGRFNLEDSLFAGALADMLLNTASFNTVCDSAYASQDLWDHAKDDPVGYIEKAAQKHRLRKNNLDDAIPFCFSTHFTVSIPQYLNGAISDSKKLNRK